MIRKFSILFLCFATSLFGKVTDSIVPQMDQMITRDLSGKINAIQQEAIDAVLAQSHQKVRVMSFNILFNPIWSEMQLDKENQWPARLPRLVEYITMAQPDIIGCQECLDNQLDALMEEIGGTYAVFQGAEEPIFYRTERFEVIEGKTVAYNKRHHYNAVTFRDLQTEKVFTFLNTHLAFGNLRLRHDESEQLSQKLMELTRRIPVIVTGDFNTFPFRQELETPFYDGPQVLATIGASGVSDSLEKALFGHFGPLASTNFCSEKKRPFCSLGTPGVILDHIFTNPFVTVLTHGIDPARVDGGFPSDHFPIIADIIVH